MYLVNILDHTSWTNAPVKNWNCFKLAIQDVIEDSFSIIVHNYTFPPSLEWTFSVSDSNYSGGLAALHQQNVQFQPHSSPSTLPTLYVQGGKTIVGTISFPETVMNIDSITCDLPQFEQNINSNTIVDTINYDDGTNSVTSHTLTVTFVVPDVLEDTMSNSITNPPTTVNIVVKNLCKEEYTAPLFTYVVDTMPPIPLSVIMTREHFNNGEWSTITTYGDGSFVNGWTGIVDAERFKWTLEFNELLNYPIETIQILQVMLQKITGSNATEVYSKTDPLKEAPVNGVYEENNNGTSTLHVFFPHTAETQTHFESLSRIEQSLHVGCELNCMINTLWDRAGNTYNYDSESSNPSNPNCTVLIKTKSPEIVTYSIQVIGNSTDFWNQVFVSTGTELQVQIDFDCIVNIANINWTLPNGTSTSSDVPDIFTSENITQFASTGTWKYIVQQGDVEIQFGLMNIADQYGNVLQTQTVPTTIFNTVEFLTNDNTSPDIIYRKVGDTVTLSINVETPILKPLVNIAGQSISEGNITNAENNSDPSVQWSVSYDIMEPIANIPVQGSASIFIRTEDDVGNKNLCRTANNVLFIDTVAPELNELTVTSSNVNNAFASVSNVITLAISTNESITNVSGSWFSETDTPVQMTFTSTTSSQWISQVTVSNSFPTGDVSFALLYNDLAGNTSTCNQGDLTSSNVYVDTLKPVVTYFAKYTNGMYSLKFNEPLIGLTTLDTSIDGIQTDISIISNVLLGAVIGSHVQIENEIVEVTAVSDNVLTVVRGLQGTVHTSHASNVPVTIMNVLSVENEEGTIENRNTERNPLDSSQLFIENVISIAAQTCVEDLAYNSNEGANWTTLPNSVHITTDYWNDTLAFWSNDSLIDSSTTPIDSIFINGALKISRDEIVRSNYACMMGLDLTPDGSLILTSNSSTLEIFNGSGSIQTLHV